MLENLLGQLLHLRRHSILRATELFQMQIDGNFVLQKDVVQIKQIMEGHENGGVHETVPCQECLEVHVLLVGPKVVLKFYHVEILLRMPSFIVEIFQIHFREHISTVVFCSFERFVVKDGDNFGLSFGLIGQGLPQFLVFVLPEEHPVEGVGKAWIIEITSHSFESFFEKRM